MNRNGCEMHGRHRGYSGALYRDMLVDRARKIVLAETNWALSDGALQKILQRFEPVREGWIEHGRKDRSGR